MDFFLKVNSKYVSWAANQNIRMMFKGSYDTEDWSNAAENSALPSHKLHKKN